MESPAEVANRMGTIDDVCAGSLAEAHTETSQTGLTDTEVRARRLRGEGNDEPPSSSRSYVGILLQNAFTFINIILYVTCLALIAMGLFEDAILTAGLVLLSVTIAVIQEVRAKRTLDHLALLTRPTVTVVRDGQEKTIHPPEVVVDDLIVVRPGDQLVVDGELIGSGSVEIDESLLTGEADPVTKRSGDTVYSGSFCLAGRSSYVARSVGRASRANRLTAGARAYRVEKTPLQHDIDAIVRVMVIAVIVVGGPILLDFLVGALHVILHWFTESLPRALEDVYGDYPLQETVRSAAVVVALVPQGLALMIVVAYGMAAVRIAGRGALLQHANAVESLAHIDVLCLDKTGSLTTNDLVLDQIHAINVSQEEFAHILGDVVSSMRERNRTAEAIATAFPGHARAVREELHFTSDRKWSGVRLEDDQIAGTFVLGAPEVLTPALTSAAGIDQVQADWAAQGRRVLLCAHRPDAPRLHDDQGEGLLPTALIPLGMIALVDELRPEAGETLRRFAELNIQLKLISGDDPRTVEALIRQTGFPISGAVVSGLDLGGSDSPDFAERTRDIAIFGRTTPEQKADIVRALRAQGRYVAMVGDGVNDILAMKQANVGIAVRSGSAATRGVADLVLLNDSFSVLPAAFREGQRIVAGMHSVVSLFLVRAVFVLAMIVGAALVAMPFPVTPKTSALLSLITVGIPTSLLIFWARPAPIAGRLVQTIIPLVLPAALTMAPLALTLYLAWWRITGDLAIARTVLALTGTLCGLFLIPYAQPLSPPLVGGKLRLEDRRPLLLAVALLAVVGVIFAVPRLRLLFDVVLLSPRDLPWIIAPVLIWAFAMRWAWRVRFFHRLFRINGITW